MLVEPFLEHTALAEGRKRGGRGEVKGRREAKGSEKGERGERKGEREGEGKAVGKKEG